MNTNELSPSDWKAIIENQEKSGLSQKEFCAQNNITVGQLGYHKGLLNGKKYEKKAPLFSTVKIQKPESKVREDIKILLPNGFQCIFSSTMEASKIKSFIEALLSC